jgi:hypothetical protein
VAPPEISARLRLAWALALALVLASAVVPAVAGPAEPRWTHERTVVFTFALTLIAMVSGIGSLALRETLVRTLARGGVDPRTPQGAGYAAAMLQRAWALCGAVGLLGGFVAWVAAAPAFAIPYVAGATALLLFEAPRRSVLDPSR